MNTRDTRTTPPHDPAAIVRIAGVIHRSQFGGRGDLSAAADLAREILDVIPTPENTDDQGRRALLDLLERPESVEGVLRYRDRDLNIAVTAGDYATVSLEGHPYLVGGSSTTRSSLAIIAAVDQLIDIIEQSERVS